MSTEWSLMYPLNWAMNKLLVQVEEIELSAEKKNTIRAWSYYWKGYAYSRIGSMYVAGIINDAALGTNNRYWTRQEMIAEAELNFFKADTLLQKLNNHIEYASLMAKLLPKAVQVGKGFPPRTEEWIRNINTLRARNILVNTPVTDMTGAQWGQILALATNGLRQTDPTFTCRTHANGGLPGGGPALGLIGPAGDGGGRNTVSMRLIQDFKAGDKRQTNNFNQIPAWRGPRDRGNSFNTSYLIVNRGKNMSGVIVYANNAVGAHENYISAIYEENVLMLAEANIYKGNIDAGLAFIDELRAYQGAGLAPVAGTGLTLDQAKEELRRERRVGLAFRGFSFYDARRWGVLKNSRTGCTVIDFAGAVHTNATIHFGYMEYWEVPVSEFLYNPPSADSAPIVNPN